MAMAMGIIVGKILARVTRAREYVKDVRFMSFRIINIDGARYCAINACALTILKLNFKI